ncbi:MAG: anti-sigma F factor [Oscillospiraceae bacterium]|nr:anti-sigma F factor [Oscillospiraceae bacterium]
MKVLNEMKLSFLSKSANESFSRVAISAFVSQLDPTTAEIADIKMAVSEAVTNAIVHAYVDKMGVIFLQAKLLEGNILYIKIRDKGCGIENVKQAMEPMFTTGPAEERAGLGFAVMESFMDKVRVSSKLGKGTTVTMYKKINSKEEGI